jgi:hypothetical protein
MVNYSSSSAPSRKTVTGVWYWESVPITPSSLAVSLPLPSGGGKGFSATAVGDLTSACVEAASWLRKMAASTRGGPDGVTDPPR